MLTYVRPMLLWLVIVGCLSPLAAGDNPAAVPEPPITDADRQHWSFRPLQRPPLPSCQQSHLAANPIDLFIMARLEEVELTPLPPAERQALMRRVCFDLTGLPPLPEEIDRFLEDDAPGAYERLVDRLLASPAYGERWAQHWLDLARYADTDGFEFDHERPEAWRYRDWVIEALNADLPYDQFVRLQIAGDQLHQQGQGGGAEALRHLFAATTSGGHVATGFCLAGPDMPDINSQEERRHNLLNEMTGTVASVFLALQMECAQCHDHKYDPISQADFYRLRAFFEPALEVTKNQSVKFFDGRKLDLATHLMVRGDWQRPGPQVAPAFPRVLTNNYQELPEGTDRRVALADWLTCSDHPLTSRVLVNRLWQHHFSEGLSRSPSDFGAMGQPPSHPELLDWLACELVESGWSIKHLQRLIVTSATYQRASIPSQSSGTDSARQAARRQWEQAQAEDPGNELLAHFPRQRLEGEAIRDAMLRSAGLLLSQRGGPGVRPPLPEELVETLLKKQWEVTAERSQHYRRSIYVFARRNLRYPIFEVFDRPDANASCPRRNQSTTAPQSLLLLNDAFSLQIARHLAGQVIAEEPEESQKQLELLYRRTLGRFPSPGELDDAKRFLEKQRGLLEAEGRAADVLALPAGPGPTVEPHYGAALVDLSLALINCNEFLYLE